MTTLANKRSLFRIFIVLAVLSGLPLAPLLAQSTGSVEEQAVTRQSPVDGVTWRDITTNGIHMRVAEAGPADGPLLLLAHGWPESWYSWRHQFAPLVAEGYHVVAPMMRGYGDTDAPVAVDDYDIEHLANDMVGVLDAFGAETAILAGHDWGAIVAWNTVLLHPDRFTALIAMSVPYSGRAARSPMDSWREAYGDNFYYILYHNEAGGVAEAEYDADPRGLLSRLYLSPSSPREAPEITDPKRIAGGWIGRLGAAKELPDWLAADDLDYIVAQFEQSGFRGGVNYYRNFHRNWVITEHLQDVKITIPTLFIAGSRDVVIGGASLERLQGAMSRVVEDLRGVVLIPEIGHWVQQEAAAETNAAMLEFLRGL